MRKYYLLAILLLCFCVQPVTAEVSYGTKEEETKLLPPYCGGPGGGDWRAILGEQILFNNHTCYGITKINRYYKAKGAKERRAQLEGALDDFSYSVSHLTPDFKLMPEIYMYRGVTYKLLGENAKAVSDLSKSISLDPKYSRSVAELADIYDSAFSKRDKALGLVTEGLRHNPDSKELKRRYTKFGGKPPFPQPYEQSADRDVSSKKEADKSPPDLTITPESAAKQTPSEPPGSTAIPAKVSSGTSAKDGTTVNPPQPAIGSPSNPWCRFCPDAVPTQDPSTSRTQAEPTATP